MNRDDVYAAHAARLGLTPDGLRRHVRVARIAVGVLLVLFGLSVWAPGAVGVMLAATLPVFFVLGALFVLRSGPRR